MKSFNDTDMSDLIVQRRIPERPPRKRMVTAFPPRQHKIAMAAHATMMRMIRAGFRYDVAMRAWVKRGDCP